MLVKFARLPFTKDQWIRLKCFYEEDGQYGEFYINIHPFKKIILIQSKEGYYGDVLTAAFKKPCKSFDACVFTHLAER